MRIVFGRNFTVFKDVGDNFLQLSLKVIRFFSPPIYIQLELTIKAGLLVLISH